MVEAMNVMLAPIQRLRHVLGRLVAGSFCICCLGAITDCLACNRVKPN